MKSKQIINWPELMFPPVNLYTKPYQHEPTMNPSDPIEAHKKILEQVKDQGQHYRFFHKVKVNEVNFQQGYVEIQLDPFRLQNILNIQCAVAFTVFKKSIRWGGSEAKDIETDLKDIISACERKLDMIKEDKR